MGEHARAVETGKLELTIAADFRNFGGKVVANFRVGQAHHALGDYGQAVDFLGRDVEELDGDLAGEHLGLIGPGSGPARAPPGAGPPPHALGDYGQAVDFLGRNVEELDGDLAGEHFGLIAPVSVLSRTWLLFWPARRGEFAKGIARGEE